MRSPLQAQIVQWLVAPDDTVRSGDLLLVLEAMKMEHELRAVRDGRVHELFFAVGETVQVDDVLLSMQPWTPPRSPLAPASERDPAQAPAAPRADWTAWRARERLNLDAARPDAVNKRHALGLRTARENIADLCDEDSFIEYGALAIAAQRSRRSEADLIANTPADGMVTRASAR